MNTNRIARFAALLTLWPCLAGAGEIVELKMPSGLWATAEYRQGDRQQPAILLLHGLLQTRNFPTVKRLADALAESGYGVLTPTLTLGINRRQRSLDCEALHTHGMSQDLAEIDTWVHWLSKMRGAPPVLIGHSAGSIQLLAYLKQKPTAPVSRLGLISLTYFGTSPSAYETAADAARAKQALATGAAAPQHFGLAFCRNYLSPPALYLSYLDWGADALATAAATLSPRPWIIYGGNDPRMDRTWLMMLKTKGVVLRRIPGANHFFDQTHEFDLLETVEMLLSGKEPQA